MRLVAFVLAIPVALGLTVMLGNSVFQPPPASQRLAGVTVSVSGHNVVDLGGNRHRLILGIRVASVSTINECLGFALDEPFGSQRFADPAGGCLKPRAGTTSAELTYDGLTDDDLAFSTHTLVWGIPGGRCGLIMSALGMCVVEQAGTVGFNLPSRSLFPTFGPFGTFAPIPIYTLPPELR